MTLDEELDKELINFRCKQFEESDCLEALETCLVPLQSDLNSNASYTLVPGAFDRMRAAYSRRLAELREGK